MTFYVYRLTDASGATRYIGKGLGSRLSTSLRHRSREAGEQLVGEKVWEGNCEQQAYARERALIKAFQPDLNKHPGGNGGKAGMSQGLERDIKRLGTREYSRLLLISLWDIACKHPWIDTSEWPQESMLWVRHECAIRSTA